MKRRLALLSLLLLPALCAAELSSYQKTVVATFAAAGTEKPLAAAYEADNAGRATAAQKAVIRNSELIHEDLVLNGCVWSNMAPGLSLDDTIAKVVAAGQGPALVSAARALFTPAEFSAGVPSAGTPQDQAIAAAVMLASGSRLEAGAAPEFVVRAMRRRVTLNYFISFATDGKCKPTPQAKALVGKPG